ncbi:MAG: DNA mismatch repair endonuclease MutL, partial [Bacteroidales bacterium]
MSHFIQLLPESVANQIAAGEVVQRPASVVKELLENSVDAGAFSISLVLREAGKNLIQVIDNGCGMSGEDARLSFERHATSKIREAADLFSLHTFGFRGEALPSIASVSEVIMESRRQEDELGVQIRVAASVASPAEPVHCPTGTQISVKNLFYNTPARRRFLKGNATELKHIINEFQRVALTHPEIAFSLHHNQQEIYHLPASNYRQRIVQLFGKQINANLVPVNADTQVVKISGFISKPEYAKKSSGEQFFFVNGRFVRSPFLHKAVTRAYDELLGQELYPTYFLYLDVDPEALDVNIHPTKTEVKFEHEQPVFQIMYAAVRAALGKFNIIPSIDFEEDTTVEIPVLRPGTPITPPQVDIDPFYNPFLSASEHSYPDNRNGEYTRRESEFENNRSQLYEDSQENLLFRSPPEEIDTPIIKNHWIQLKNRYILT